MNRTLMAEEKMSIYDFTEETLLSTVKSVLNRYLFFNQENLKGTSKLTKEEMYILDEFRSDIPGLLRSVMQSCSAMIAGRLWQGK